MTLPRWYSDEIYDRLVNGFKDGLNLLTFTPYLTKLYGGPLVKTWLKNMNVENKYNNKRKMYIYSGHDLSVYSVAKAHQVKLPGKTPDVGAAFILEKYRDSNNKLYVKVISE